MAAGKPAPGPGDEARSAFIRSRFSRYYSEAGALAPKRLPEREFGVITERGGMWRHLGFPNDRELQSFLRKQVPLHAYHSSAYYRKPNARTMDEKGWLGADLVFDLDADHLVGTENMSYEEMLAAVKVQFEKLLDSYLLGDFGFGEEDVKIVFSGGRGYHAHVSSDRVLGLDSHERREIVDYITWSNPNLEMLVKRDIFDSKEFQGHVSTKYVYRLYPEDTPGWRGKVTASVMQFISRTEGLGREEILDELVSFKGIGDTLAVQIYNSLYKGKKGERGIDKIRNDLNLEPFSSDKVRNSFINHIIGEMSVQLGGETDEPVTSDIKRLIRLPGSLHGKSSLVVKELDVNGLRDFLPLRDAVWIGFDSGTVKVKGLADYEVKLKGEDFRIAEGREEELPEHTALFLACQKKCEILL